MSNIIPKIELVSKYLSSLTHFLCHDFLKICERFLILVHPLDKKVIKRANVPTGKRDPEPCLSDFHEPFHGEAVPMTLDSKEIKAKIAEKFYQQDPDWRQKFISNRTKFQDNFKR